MNSSGGSIHSRIRQLRRAKGWTQQQLADAVSLSKAAVSQWETEGGTSPRMARLLAVATALDTTTDYLTGGQLPLGQASTPNSELLPQHAAVLAKYERLARAGALSDYFAHELMGQLLSLEKGGRF